jgi:hypothetical protein
MMVDEWPKYVVNNRQPISGVISKIQLCLADIINKVIINTTVWKELNITYVRKASDYLYILQCSLKSVLYVASRKLGYFHQYPDIISWLGRKKGMNKNSERQTYSSVVCGEIYTGVQSL